MTLPSTLSDRYWAGAFVLVLLTLAVYQKALWFVPSSGDDLRILSSVSQRRNPLSYFVTDWGMDNTYRLGSGQIDYRRKSYRPLHSISIWLGYRLFGVSAYPNQLINLALHTLNGFLLLGILRRLRLDVFLSLLLATLAVVSLYTASPATWVSDRQTLVVAFATLVLLNHLVDAEGRLKTSLNPWLVTGLTVLAVSFKESGLIVPLVAGAFVIFAPYAGARWRHLAVCVSLVIAYIGLRLLLFGSNAFAYTSEGFVFGNQPYAVLSDLPWHVGLWARFENVAKNLLCVFLPIIDSVGSIDSRHDLLQSVFWWLPTIALTIFSTQRPITPVQRLALAVIAVNSALHVQVFRYRVEYIPQFAFCLYVAGSSVWRAIPDRADGFVWRQSAAAVCCGFLALVSISQVNHYVQSNWVERQDDMTKRRLATVIQKYPISENIVRQVLARYADVAETAPAKTP